MTFWDRWKDRLSIIRNTPDVNPNVRPEDRNSVPKGRVDRIEDQIKSLQSVVDEYFQYKSEHRTNRADSALNANLDVFRNMLLDLEAQVLVQKRVINRLMDMRDQEDFADKAEKLRLFMFRMATGIGLAVILLATYWTADFFGIPMPLRMQPQTLPLP